MIKCLVSDLDGTLFLGHQETVFDLSLVNEKALEKVRNSEIHFYVASGRTVYYGIELLKKYGFDDIILAGFNGSIIFDNGSTIERHCLNNSQVISLIEKIETTFSDFLNIQLQGFNGDRIFYYFDKISSKLIDELNRNQIGKIIDSDLKKLINQGFDIAKLSITFETKEKCNECFQIINEEWTNFFYMAQSNPTLIEIVDKSSNKGNFIRYLSEKFNFKREEIACIGDEMNDLEMFDYCGTTFAMSNGNERVKEKAKYIVQNVAECIEKCIQLNAEEPISFK